MKSTGPSGLGTRHDTLIAEGAQARPYQITVTVRTFALDDVEAQEIAEALVDSYNGYRFGLPEHSDGPAVVIRDITLESVQ